MNKGRIILLMAGFITGASIGYYIGKKQEEEKANEQIRLANEHFRKRYEAKLNENTKDQLVESLGTNKQEQEDLKKIERNVKIPDNGPISEDFEQKVNYNKMSKSIKKEEKYIHEGPYEVQPGTYDDFLGIDRFDLTFFAEDEVIMDSKEQVWNDTERLGDIIFNVDNYGRYEPDIMYIINEDFAQGYKITLDMGSYDEYMAGVEDL